MLRGGKNGLGQLHGDNLPNTLRISNPDLPRENTPIDSNLDTVGVLRRTGNSRHFDGLGT